MKRAIVFSLEALLVLLSSAALIYSLQPAANDASFSAWRAKLLAEDVGEAFAQASLGGEVEFKEILQLAGKLGGNCVEISYKSREEGVNCGLGGGNSVVARRIVFDGSSFYEVAVRVRYG